MAAIAVAAQHYPLLFCSKNKSWFQQKKQMQQKHAATVIVVEHYPLLLEQKTKLVLAKSKAGSSQKIKKVATYSRSPPAPSTTILGHLQQRG